MISSLELCQIVESAFLPARCKCSVDSAGLMSVQLYSGRTGHADLLATGIATSTLTTSRAIASLISDLKAGLQVSSASGDGAADGYRKAGGARSRA
ncbi:MAG TPA: DUF1652 domain-containing protein [Pseudomonas sp.]|jgi:hypothetical protein|uniref:DUF1652 domain-containing protein n=1 Tax=Pseudomonas sp. NPDC087358 TaxID=3364439 RepID=UPI002C79866B|nr:DUF1652 domain-containing protein [Pseudomonas sp.]